MENLVVELVGLLLARKRAGSRDHSFNNERALI